MKNKRLSLILMITNRLYIFKSIVQKQLKIHILIGALCDHQKDIWMKLKEWLNLETDKGSARCFQYFAMIKIEKNAGTKTGSPVDNEKVDVYFRFH